MQKGPYLIITCIILLSLSFSVPALGKGQAEIIATYKLDGEEVNVFISTYPKATDLEGRLKEKAVFYFLKLKYKNNFYSFNLPEGCFKNLAEKKKEELIKYLIDLYDRSFEVFQNIFGYIPEGFKFNITFGKTKRGHAFNYVYLVSKTSNIFPDFVPYSKGKDVMTPDERKTMFHEIGHSMFGIIIGSMQNPKTKAFEEGFVDYFAEEATGEKIDRSGIIKIRITREQAKRMRGLTQGDIDATIWNKEVALKPSVAKGYIGITHHVFGLEFMHAFIDVFGEENLPEFLTLLRQKENEIPAGKLGTEEVKKVFETIGYSQEKIKKFETELHNRLKKNIFNISAR